MSTAGCSFSYLVSCSSAMINRVYCHLLVDFPSQKKKNTEAKLRTFLTASLITSTWNFSLTWDIYTRAWIHLKLFEKRKKTGHRIGINKQIWPCAFYPYLFCGTASIIWFFTFGLILFPSPLCPLVIYSVPNCLIQILVLLLTTCINFSKLLNFSEPQPPCL